jgi:thiol-disulfide isomerase/thioredoxin
MNKNTLLLLILIFAVIVGAIHIAEKERPDAKKIADEAQRAKAPATWLGRTPPDFELVTLDGQVFKLSEHIGKEIVIINFFATYCYPCRQEMPELGRFSADSKGKPIVLVGVNTSEKQDKVEAFIKEYNVDYPVIIDGSEELQRKYMVGAYPTTVFIGVDGKVQLYEVGPITNAEVAFRKLVDKNIEDLSAGRAISTKDYLKASVQPPVTPAPPTPFNRDMQGSDVGCDLTGRARKIAEKMTCPCGCEDKVIGCKCKTAMDIKKKLKVYEFGSKTDEEVIKDLDKEFCVKGEPC